MLPTAIALEDIADCEAFVAGCLESSGIRFSADEHEDLLAEGLAVLFALHAKYEPHMPGYATSGRFSGYAAMFLPRRLGDAWHRSHPEHRYSMDPETGKRKWEFLPRPVSIEAMQDNSRRGGRDAPGEAVTLESRFLPRSQWSPVQPLTGDSWPSAGSLPGGDQASGYHYAGASSLGASYDDEGGGPLG